MATNEIPVSAVLLDTGPAGGTSGRPDGGSAGAHAGAVGAVGAVGAADAGLSLEAGMRPPGTLSPPKFTLRDYFGLAADDDFAARLRTTQFYAYYDYMPFNLAVAALAMVVLTAEFGSRIGALGFTLAAAATAVSVLLGIAHKRRWKGELRHTVSRRDLVFLLCRMFLAGAAWGAICLSAIANAGASDAMLAVALAVAAIATLTFSTSAWPLGALVLIGTVVACTSAGLVLLGGRSALLVGIVLAGSALFLMRAVAVSARTLMTSIATRQQLDRQEGLMRLLLNEFDANGSEWLFEFAASGRLTFASARMGEVFHRPVKELFDQPWTELVSPEHGGTELAELIRDGRPFRNLLVGIRVDGERRWLSISATPKFDNAGRPSGYRGVGSDVTDRHRAAERIAELATFDPLTGLVNRRVVHQSLAEMLAGGCNAEPRAVALLFVDLDRFKAVNDSLGHGAGDRLLIEVARRMRSHVSRNCCDCALAGRLGGDEFAIVLCVGDGEHAAEIGRAVIEELSRPYDLGGKQAVIGASIGMALGPRDGATVEELMRAADLALYDAKSKGRGTVCCYDQARHQLAKNQHSLELDLRRAIVNRQLYLAFQPVVDAADERVVGFEALLRWQHPVLGNIPPLDFIPIAEEVGLIGEIGAWVLDEACRVTVTWPRHIRCAVNVSPKQFDDPEFPETVRRTLRRWNLDPARLELELTESLFLEPRPRTAEMLRELDEMGVGFALDDFGTGYSSLGYLQKIAFRRIKIDRSFVGGCAAPGGESIAIIQAIVALAGRLGIHTIAEGTETRREFEIMRGLGCEQMQGYYFGKPMSVEDAARLLARGRPKLELVAMPELRA